MKNILTKIAIGTLVLLMITAAAVLLTTGGFGRYMTLVLIGIVPGIFIGRWMQRRDDDMRSWQPVRIAHR